jgi:2-deoxystreptamine N-acetyl-D-glucosaminyltransferase/2-deoxystreptamine glucosyltransferase
MPTVLPEAAAAGLPLVGSDLAGIPLLVRDGETGLLVPSGDAAALSAALATLVRDADLRTRLGEGARAAVAEFAWPRIAARFANVYAEAIEQSRWRQQG